ncbi:hypothetical protein TNIN_251821 [Trichonephila inaurata madagascariensis]|uniref:Uncharacterized protein n=1 Tax=Trichonephila inaurata madagascariensis TaxID=2747483 RepID=A0A8X6YU62_9ARAC|nr:hypothetical protein TNIN_251821 [Trichonephila inaurata madagascariensis]
MICPVLYVSRQRIFVSVPTESKGSLTRGYCSVVEHSTADREVFDSHLGVLFFREVKINILLRISKAGMICPVLYISSQSIFVSVPMERKAKVL